MDRVLVAGAQAAAAGMFWRVSHCQLFRQCRLQSFYLSFIVRVVGPGDSFLALKTEHSLLVALRRQLVAAEITISERDLENEEMKKSLKHTRMIEMQNQLTHASAELNRLTKLLEQSTNSKPGTSTDGTDFSGGILIMLYLVWNTLLTVYVFYLHNLSQFRALANCPYYDKCKVASLKFYVKMKYFRRS